MSGHSNGHSLDGMPETKPAPELSNAELFDMLKALSEIVTRMSSTVLELVNQHAETRQMVEGLKDRGE